MSNNDIQKVFNIFNEVGLREQQIILEMLNRTYLDSITVGDVTLDSNIEESIHHIMSTDDLLGRSINETK